MRRAIPLILLSLLVLAGCTEDGRFGVTFINQGEHTIDDGQTIIGNVFVAGGDVVLEPRGAIDGSLYVLGGDVFVDSRVEGDVAALGGSVTIADNAVIAGNFYTAGSEVQRSAAAQIAGEETSVAGQRVSPIAADGAAAIAGRLLGLLGMTILVSLLAGFLVRLMPQVTGRVSTTAFENPVMSGSLGLLLLLVLPALLVFMVFTIVLIPFTLAGLAILVLFVSYGMVGIGRGTGEVLASRLHWNLTPPVAAMLGTAVIAVLLSLVSLVPIAAEVMLAIVGALALGAVVLSGFGTRIYQPPDYDAIATGESEGARQASQATS
jgi:hypothetical protein